MDSMKSLNTSLPKTSHRRQTQHPPEQLLQSFKDAALAVTNLYRGAEAAEHRARQSGYQDALDELLSFLDKGNIGLGDGEGWQVRQWATERLDDRPARSGASESEEEGADPAKLSRNSSNTNQDTQRSPSLVMEEPKPRIASPVRTRSASAGDETASRVQRRTSFTSESFTFRSNLTLPQDVDMQPQVMSQVDQSGPDPMMPNAATPALTVNVLPRSARSSRTSKHPARQPTVRGLGSGAGTKRRVTFGDYFDLANLDASGSAKRGKLS